MARQVLETRVEGLERRVTNLEQLPERMDRLESQILQLRREMRDEFSAVGAEMATGEEETRRVLREEIGHGNVMIITELTEQTEAVRRDAGVLFENALGRIAVVGEGLIALSDRVDGLETRLSIQFERADAKLDLVLARLDRLARDQH